VNDTAFALDSTALSVLLSVAVVETAVEVDSVTARVVASVDASVIRPLMLFALASEIDSVPAAVAVSVAAVPVDSTILSAVESVRVINTALFAVSTELNVPASEALFVTNPLIAVEVDSRTLRVVESDVANVPKSDEPSMILMVVESAATRVTAVVATMSVIDVPSVSVVARGTSPDIAIEEDSPMDRVVVSEAIALASGADESTTESVVASAVVINPPTTTLSARLIIVTSAVATGTKPLIAVALMSDVDKVVTSTAAAPARLALASVIDSVVESGRTRVTKFTEPSVIDSVVASVADFTTRPEIAIALTSVTPMVVESEVPKVPKSVLPSTILSVVLSEAMVVAAVWVDSTIDSAVASTDATRTNPLIA
jgi:hypothetical protein